MMDLWNDEYERDLSIMNDEYEWDLLIINDECMLILG